MVYCSKLFDTQIQAISYPSLQVNKTFSTSLPPKKIFRDGNKLISLCGAFPANTSGSMVPWYFIIETFNLP
jgi:hypothetical protein